MAARRQRSRNVNRGKRIIPQTARQKRRQTAANKRVERGLFAATRRRGAAKKSRAKTTMKTALGSLRRSDQGRTVGGRTRVDLSVARAGKNKRSSLTTAGFLRNRNSPTKSQKVRSAKIASRGRFSPARKVVRRVGRGFNSALHPRAANGKFRRK